MNNFQVTIRGQGELIDIDHPSGVLLLTSDEISILISLLQKVIKETEK